MLVPPKLGPGDRVAVVSPSAGLPAIFPVPFELGTRRLRDVFGLVPVEYPTTRTMNAPPADRAKDLHAAFADPDIKAVLATIGGEDEITVLPHLDAELLAANPKLFLGFSDNTCLLTYLYELGVVAYHGGHVMNAFGRSGRMHPMVEASLRAALLTTGEYELPVADAYRDTDLPSWDDPAFAETEPELEPCEGWTWYNADRVVEGTSWGGNLETLGRLLMAGRIGPSERYAGNVLVLETSEELPSAVEVYRTLRNMGERGCWASSPRCSPGGRRHGRWSAARRRTKGRRTGASSARRSCAPSPSTPPTRCWSSTVDLGHTDPQLVLPYGGRVRVEGPARRIVVTY